MPNQSRSPLIDWVRIKSLTVDGTTLQIVYDDARRVAYKFKSKAELLKALERRRDREK